MIRYLTFFILALFYSLAEAQQISQPGPATSVISNTVLTGSPTSAFPNGVWRNTYATGVAAPAPPLFYLPSAGACALNSGNGDNGSQVKSSDGKCWIAQFPDRSRIDIRQFGAVPYTGTGTPTVANDVAPAIRTAFAARVGRLYVPGGLGVWPLMSEIAAADYPFKLVGDYPQELQGSWGCPTGAPSGTWFRIANLAARFLVQEGATANATMGTEFSSFGVCQDHPAPSGPSWAPTTYFPAITLSSTAGCNINRIYWYGVYDAISATNSARCTVSEQRGQFFHWFWTADHLLDMTQWHNWHLWPFRSGYQADVIAWQKANGEVARLQRVDGLHATSVFALGYKEVVHFVRSTDATEPGPAAAVYFGPLYCDSVRYCVHIDPDAGNTVASFGYLTYGGEDVVNSTGLQIEGGGSNISVATMYCLASYGPCVNVTGPNSFVGIGWAYATDYDTANLGNNAFRANSTDAALPSYIALGQYPTGTNTGHGGGTPAADNTAPNGYVSVGGVITRDYVPALTFGGASAGIIYSGTPSGKIQKNWFTGEVHGSVKMTLTNKGTSTGPTGVSLPPGFAGPTAPGRFERDQMGSAIWHNGFLGSPTAPFVFAPANALGLQLLQNGTGGFLTDANFTNTTSIQFAW